MPCAVALDQAGNLAVATSTGGLDGQACTGNTIYEIAPGEVFSIRDLRLHLLAHGQHYTLPEQPGGLTL